MVKSIFLKLPKMSAVAESLNTFQIKFRSEVNAYDSCDWVWFLVFSLLQIDHNFCQNQMVDVDVERAFETWDDNLAAWKVVW